MGRVLLPLTPLYSAAVAAKNAAYDRGLARPRRLVWPVISVGNISVGGSGKTPFVIALANLLQRQGLQVDVLSRGYGRNSDAVERVDSAGDPERFGDEPLLISQSVGIPVYVGASRYAAGLLAESTQTGPRIHLLDDGLQHRQLARAVDIVLLHRTDFDEALLPAGRLREPMRSLKRASILVLREGDGDLEQELRLLGIDQPIWWIRRTIVVPGELRIVVAFCGIARPDEFLRQPNVEFVATRAFRDHHRYSDDDMRGLVREAQTNLANAFLTTEKDFVRLSQKQKEMLTSIAPLRVAKLEVRLCDEAAAVSQLETLLQGNSHRSL